MFDIHATTAPAFAISVDGDEFRFADLNAEYLRHVRSGALGLLGKRPQDYFPAPLADTLNSNYRRCAQSGLSITYELESVLPTGCTYWRTTLVPIVSPKSGAVVALVGVCNDSTAERMVDRATNTFHEALSQAIGVIEGGFWTLHPATGAFEASRPLTDLLAGPGHAPLNLAEYINFVFADDLALFPDLANDSSAEFRVMTFDGRTRWLQSKRRVVRDEQGLVTQIVGLVLDITDEKLRRQTLEIEATTDDLTGLKNRRSFERSAAHLLSYPFDAGRPFSLLLIDLDGFKPVNDKYGHQAGDGLLREVAKRIARLVRPEDTLARIGGDEFAILLRHGDPVRMVERLERAFARPFRNAQTSIPVGASIGTTIQQPSDRTLPDLMDRADKALYAVKNHRRRTA